MHILGVHREAGVIVVETAQCYFNCRKTQISSKGEGVEQQMIYIVTK